ncbi:phosphoglycerate mutase [Acidovorax sp. SUPP3334]|uniref:phosphoglycerate mutase n=1 Tax=Acidovorax sp. SUPP3334 TaxID=2920881 RepID=UPI0023DE263B|nr:phosphoglycerate mutase [Acidovorax sp. SUPP3334]GKT20277.1 phosphoglycerate mutase [Acidovorax sp. SUPP3334]
MSDTPHLLIPFAASPSDGCQHALQDLALPHLDRLLSRLPPPVTDAGDETDFIPPHERALARHLGLPATNSTAPWAAWHQRQASDGGGDGAARAFVAPCEWRVTTEHVTVGDPDALGLDEAASRELLAIVAPWFAEDGIELAYERPTRWLARGAVFEGLATASLDRVIQRDVRAWMPDAAKARVLHRLQSEMQMLLYTHAFNDARAARGLGPVNSFWVHGTGSLPPSVSAAAPAPAPEIEIPLTLRDAALAEDWRAWRAAWQALDSGPVARLADRVAAGGAAQLILCGERNALAWRTGPRGFAQRLQSLFRPQRFKDAGTLL